MLDDGCPCEMVLPVFVRRRLDTLKDAFGRVPNDYDLPASAVTHFSVRQEAVGPAAQGRPPAPVVSSAVSVTADGTAAVAYDPADDGRWGETVFAFNRREGCDVREYQVRAGSHICVVPLCHWKQLPVQCGEILCACVRACWIQPLPGIGMHARSCEMG